MFESQLPYPLTHVSQLSVTVTKYLSYSTENEERFWLTVWRFQSMVSWPALLAAVARKWSWSWWECVTEESPHFMAAGKQKERQERASSILNPSDLTFFH
jgi:hypothetical protein